MAGYSDAVAGTFGAVTFFDVLYRIPLDGWGTGYPHAHVLYLAYRGGAGR